MSVVSRVLWTGAVGVFALCSSVIAGTRQHIQISELYGTSDTQICDGFAQDITMALSTIGAQGVFSRCAQVKVKEISNIPYHPAVSFYAPKKPQAATDFDFRASTTYQRREFCDASLDNVERVLKAIDDINVLDLRCKPAPGGFRLNGTFSWMFNGAETVTAVQTVPLR